MTTEQHHPAVRVNPSTGTVVLRLDPDGLCPWLGFERDDDGQWQVAPMLDSEVQDWKSMALTPLRQLRPATILSFARSYLASVDQATVREVFEAAQAAGVVCTKAGLSTVLYQHEIYFERPRPATFRLVAGSHAST